MAGDPKKTLGYIALQLRAQKQGADQALAREKDAKQQEIDQANKAMSVQTINSAFQQHNANEDRKLQLAGMMSKTAENVDLRKYLGELADKTKNRDITVKDENADNKLAETGAHNVVTEGIGRDKTTETGRHNSETEKNVVRGQDMGILKEFSKEGAFSGKRGMQLDSKGSIADLGASIGVTPSAPAPGGEIEVGKKGREAAIKDLDGINDELYQADDAIRQVKAAPKEFFGPIASGKEFTLPSNKLTHFLGVDKPIRYGNNTWKDLAANMDELSPEMKAKVSQKRAAEQALGRMLQAYRHRMTGAAFTDKESAGYAQTLTGISDADPLSGDQQMLIDALERTHAHIRRRAGLLAHIAKTGTRPDLSLTNDELEKLYGNGGQDGNAAPVAPANNADVPVFREHPQVDKAIKSVSDMFMGNSGASEGPAVKADRGAIDRAQAHVDAPAAPTDATEAARRSVNTDPEAREMYQSLKDAGVSDADALEQLRQFMTKKIQETGNIPY